MGAGDGEEGMVLELRWRGVGGGEGQRGREDLGWT